MQGERLLQGAVWRPDLGGDTRGRETGIPPPPRRVAGGDQTHQGGLVIMTHQEAIWICQAVIEAIKTLGPAAVLAAITIGVTK